jgi:aspartate aminotransferase-like enzyme
MTPGPAPIHPGAHAAAIEPLPHHRAPAFKPRYEAVQTGLREAFHTAGPVATLASSGTGAMEAALVNLFAPGDRVVVVAAGKFGQRWADVSEAFGLRVKTTTVEPGQAFTAEDAAEVIASRRPVAGMVITASETSTGSAIDVESIVKAARRVEPDLAVVVDAITGIGAMTIQTDAWDLDAVCGGSQKAFMIPPGLGFVACSPRGWERVREDRKKARYYFDLRKYEASAQKDQTPFTPATSLLLELEAALAAIAAAGGMVSMEKNAQALAEATRAAARAIGLDLLSPECPSPAVTAIRAPVSGSAPAIVQAMRDVHGVAIAGGQGELKPDIFRIGHLGYIDEHDLLGTLATLERVIASQGHTVEAGRAVAAAAASLDAR